MLLIQVQSEEIIPQKNALKIDQREEIIPEGP